MTHSNLSNKQEKYFFNSNNFDEQGVGEEEDVAPTFSEEELKAARLKAFEDGRQQGIKETKESRSELVAKALDVVSKNISTLLEAEERREKIFEEEAVRLTLTAFRKLAPLYHEKYGHEELINSLTSILRTQQNRKEISVHVAPGTAEGVQKMLSALTERGLNVTFSVTEDENLSQGASNLTWADGGAIIDHEQLAQEIQAGMEQVLAGGLTNSHDGGVKIEAQNQEEIQQSAKEQPQGEAEKPADMMETPDE